MVREGLRKTRKESMTCALATIDDTVCPATQSYQTFDALRECEWRPRGLYLGHHVDDEHGLRDAEPASPPILLENVDKLDPTLKPGIPRNSGHSINEISCGQ